MLYSIWDERHNDGVQKFVLGHDATTGMNLENRLSGKAQSQKPHVV